jgi:hypothetical protein
MIDWGKTTAPKPATAGTGGGIDWSKPAVSSTVNAQQAPPLPQQGPKYKPPTPMGHDPAGARRFWANLQWLSASPAGRGADTALNATSRLGTGAIAGRNPLRAAVDPAHATETTHAAERNLIETASGGHYPEWMAEPGKWGPWAQLGADVVTETAADPATYVPGLDFFSVGKRLVKAAGMVPGARRAATAVVKSKPVDRLLSATIEGHGLRKAVQRPGEDIVKGHEGAAHNAQQRAETGYTTLVEQHRPALEAYDHQRLLLRTEMGQLADAAKTGSATAQQRMAALKQAYDQTQSLIPPEIRSALLQRAYREGTPEVRRQVLAKGYKPTAEDRARQPLNILHRFQDEYEPTQTLLSPDELAQTAGAVRYVRQGNKKASFDLPKAGGTPDDPLADRVLDRLVRGARLENYHGSRRAILGGLGLAPGPDVTRTMARLTAARAAGNAEAVGRYEALLGRQNAALAEQEGRRGRTLQSDAVNTTQKAEFLDANTARARVLRDARVTDDHVIPPGLIGKLEPGSTIADTTAAAQRVTSGKQSVRDLARLSAVTRGAAEKTGAAAEAAVGGYAGRIGTAAQKARAGLQSDADRLFGRSLDANATTQQRVAKALPGEPNVSPFVDANGRPILSPSVATRKQDALTRPGANLSKAVGRFAENAGDRLSPVDRAVEQTPSLSRVTSPSRTAYKAVLGRVGDASARNARTEVRLATTKVKNQAVTEMRGRGDAMAAERNTVAVPEQIQKRLYGTIAKQNPSLAAEFSDLQRDALFVLPWAHTKNITVLQMLGPGSTNPVLKRLGLNGTATVARGIAYSQQLRKNPAALADRIRSLEDVGATQHYISEAEHTYEKAPILGPTVGRGLAKVSDWSNRHLERYDLAQRLALQDALKARGITGMEAGGIIRDTLGDYKNQSALVQELRQRWGGNFPGWRLGIVPRAMTKAVREQPNAVKQFARGERLVSDDVTNPWFGGDTDVGGPLDDYSSMIFPKPALSNFYTSPSTIGPIRSAIDLAVGASKGQAGQVAAREALRVAPFGSVAGAAMNFPFKANAPAALRVGAGLAGVYFPNIKTVKQRTAQLRALGMKGPEIQSVLRSEGLISEPSPVQQAPGMIDWGKR